MSRKPCLILLERLVQRTSSEKESLKIKHLKKSIPPSRYNQAMEKDEDVQSTPPQEPAEVIESNQKNMAGAREMCPICGHDYVQVGEYCRCCGLYFPAV